MLVLSAVLPGFDLLIFLKTSFTLTLIFSVELIALILDWLLYFNMLLKTGLEIPSKS